MSRIGKKPVTIPAGVTVSVDADVVMVKGSKGELTMPLYKSVALNISETEVTVEKKHNAKTAQAMWGTTQRLIENMITGVTEGFTRVLELNGVGYRMSVQGKKLDLALGFSHPVVLEIPEGLTAEVDNNLLKISGMDKQAIGQFAAEIRSLRPVEPYKGKGFKYDDEIVRRKEGKKAASA